MPVFRPVDPKQNFPALEMQVLDLWRQERVFERSVELRAGAPVFVFYEGPPTANGRPGVHHVLSRVFKDVFNRYKTMRGYQVPRKGGWDTQGLPVEIEVEKALGLNGKPDIERVGVARFNAECRASVTRYLADWEKLTERIAFWLDQKNAYQTCTNDYIESCWRLLRCSGTVGSCSRTTRSRCTARAAGRRSPTTRWRRASRTTWSIRRCS